MRRVTFVVAALVVFGVNLIPAFAPPTWAVLVLFRLNSDLPVVPLVVVGAVAAASGRFVLATATRALRRRLSAERTARLESWRQEILKRRAGVIAGLALFAVSPLPSGQLFVGAGLIDVPLVPCTLAFFSGRIVSYAVYVGGASLVARSYGDVATDALRSPSGIALQLVFTLAVALVPFVKRKTRPTGQVLN